MKLSSSLELLESRIAPAALSVVIVSPHKATYNDVDGDLVTVAVSTGTLTAGLFHGADGQLQLLDLSGGGFDHADLTVTVKKVAGGDGHANLGFINSTGHDLGNVSLPGDLGRIDAGDGTADLGLKSLKVDSMGQRSLDTQDAASTPTLESDIVNGLGSLTVAHDVKDAFIHVSGTINSQGTIGPIKIGGSLIGDAANDGGQIRSEGRMGAVSIGEDLRGGSGARTGMIVSNSGMGNVTVAGSILGGASTVNSQSGIILSMGAMGAVKVGHDVLFGAGSQSGYIQAKNSSAGATDGTIASVTIGGSLSGNSVSGGTIESDAGIGSIKIGHDILGGLINSTGDIGTVTLGGSLLPGNILSSGVISAGGNIGAVSIAHDIQGTSVLDSGMIFAGGNIKSVKVGGSIFGGGGNSMVNVSQSGGIFAGGDLGPVTVVHDLVGGRNGLSHDVTDSGFIEAGGKITSVSIGGSILAGANYGTGTMSRSGAIAAGRDLGSLTVAGSIIGQPGAGPKVIIAADGPLTPTATTDLAIGKITVGHRVENAQILAGYSFETPDNASAQIGTVSVGGDWIASSLVAGAINLGANHAAGGGDDNINYGNADDRKIGTAAVPTVLSRVASLTIKGALIGTPQAVSSTDHFGFVAEAFGTIKIGGVSVAIPTVPGLINLGQTTDVSLDKLA